MHYAPAFVKSFSVSAFAVVVSSPVKIFCFNVVISSRVDSFHESSELYVLPISYFCFSSSSDKLIS